MKKSRVLYGLFIASMVTTIVQADVKYMEIGGVAISVVIDNDKHIMWQDSIQLRSKQRVSHEKALKYCEDLDYVGYTDWRLPDVKNFSLKVHSLFQWSEHTGSWATRKKFQIVNLGVKDSGDYYVYDSEYFDTFNVVCVRDIK